MKFLKTMMMVAVAAVLPDVALAETHTLQPYAYVQAHGTNRIDTGYYAKPLSRYFVDYIRDYERLRFHRQDHQSRGSGRFGRFHRC